MSTLHTTPAVPSSYGEADASEATYDTAAYDATYDTAYDDTPPQDYVPPALIHIGSNATDTTVNVHIHIHNAADTADPTSGSSVAGGALPVEDTAASVVDVHATVDTAPPPPTVPRQHPSAHRPPSSATDTATGEVAGTTLSSVLGALPDGIMSPALRSVLQHVLQPDAGSVGGRGRGTATRATRASTQYSTGGGGGGGGDGAATRAHAAATDRDREPEPTAPLGNRGQNVAISLMMQPLPGRSVSLTDLFRELTDGDGDALGARRSVGVPLDALNRHTRLAAYNEDGSNGSTRHDVCAVCQEAVDDGTIVRTIVRCGHVFHAACLDRWLEANTTCPMCMQQVVPEPPEPPEPSMSASQQRPASATTRGGSGTGEGTVDTVAAARGRRVVPVSSSPEPDSPVPPLDDGAPEEAPPPSSDSRPVPIRVQRIPIRFSTTYTTRAPPPPPPPPPPPLPPTPHLPQGIEVAAGRDAETDAERILNTVLDELTLDSIAEEGDDEDDGGHHSQTATGRSRAWA